MTLPLASPLSLCFADWYATAHPNPDPEVVVRRSQCLGCVTRSISTSEIIEVVRVLLWPDSKGAADLRVKLVGQFREVDPAFPATNNQHLLDVMIAGCLAALVDEAADAGTLASLALLCASIDGAGRRPGQNELVPGARRLVANEGRRRREAAHRPLPAVPAPSAADPPPATADLELGDVAPNGWEAISANFGTVEDWLGEFSGEVRDHLSKLHASVASLSDALRQIAPRIRDTCVQALQEETQVLWWLFTERSQLGGVPFGALGDEAAVIIGVEFAGMQRLLPNHPQSPALLARALGPTADQTITLADLVRAVPPAIANGVLARYSRPSVITPVLLALQLSSDSADGWHRTWSAQTGVAETIAQTRTKWAIQVSNELVLLREITSATP